MSTDWKQIAVANVAKNHTPRSTTNKGKRGSHFVSSFPGRGVRMHIEVHVALLQWIEQACQRLNVNRSTFIRRSIAVQVASVLGIPIAEVIHNLQSPSIYHGPVQKDRGGRDDGEGIEAFCPHPGCSGQHLIP